MNTNMMLALTALVAAVFVAPASAATPAPPVTLSCDFYKHVTACQQAGCVWDSSDNDCKNVFEGASEALATFVIVLIVVGIVITLGVIACIVCCCFCGANACLKKDKEVVVVQQEQTTAPYGGENNKDMVVVQAQPATTTPEV